MALFRIGLYQVTLMSPNIPVLIRLFQIFLIACPDSRETKSDDSRPLGSPRKSSRMLSQVSPRSAHRQFGSSFSSNSGMITRSGTVSIKAATPDGVAI